MNLEDFEYPFDEKLIAQFPLKKREQARLMVVDRKQEKISHDIFANIKNYLPDSSLIVLNNSKVVPARLFGRRANTGGAVEVFLLKQISTDGEYEVLIRPLKRLKTGDEIIFPNSRTKAVLVDRERPVVRFNRKNIDRFLERQGHVPLPPYIKRPDQADDKKFYQTVYARHKGSVASPTAGLHFSKALLNSLVKNGHQTDEVTLHINYGTFKPVEEKDIRKHKIHIEEYFVTKQTYRNIQQAKRHSRKIVAVGTTSCRVLETLAKSGTLQGRTDLFIYPGFEFQTVDALITNFHLPHSTLLMLVYTFGGMELMKKAYAAAVKEKYRFYSYGDAMIII